MIDPKRCCLYVPNGLSSFKKSLFERLGAKVGRVVRGNVAEMAALPSDTLPLVGCSPELREMIAGWRGSGRRWAYWDRGYALRVFATWLPKAPSIEQSFYRFHIGSFQMTEVRDVPSDRWDSLKLQHVVKSWAKGGRHIVIAAPTRTYSRFHDTRDWIADTIDALARVTDRQLVIRDKESKRSLQSDIEGAHALVTHGSIAAVESVVLGCPVFVHRDSAAALVGQTDVKKIEEPIYPDREKWLHSLAYSQVNEREMVDGTLFRHLA
ncbi:hypothetical protein [Bradyrhizobium prioriisuperbiae]|uniref:hypothetical protein n=1 Tax=Bradyrhizobium prioriisuperbiae TaxID=2854389 RepID=UPI0028EC4805|nr:hypothetical protein [Bradyrhizobium prioritasuperba]